MPINQQKRIEFGILNGKIHWYVPLLRSMRFYFRLYCLSDHERWRNIIENPWNNFYLISFCDLRERLFLNWNLTVLTIDVHCIIGTDMKENYRRFARPFLNFKIIFLVCFLYVGFHNWVSFINRYIISRFIVTVNNNSPIDPQRNYVCCSWWMETV